MTVAYLLLFTASANAAPPPLPNARFATRFQRKEAPNAPAAQRARHGHQRKLFGSSTAWLSPRQAALVNIHSIVTGDFCRQRLSEGGPDASGFASRSQSPPTTARDAGERVTTPSLRSRPHYGHKSFPIMGLFPPVSMIFVDVLTPGKLLRRRFHRDCQGRSSVGTRALLARIAISLRARFGADTLCLGNILVVKMQAPAHRGFLTSHRILASRERRHSR